MTEQEKCESMDRAIEKARVEREFYADGARRVLGGVVEGEKS